MIAKIRSILLIWLRAYLKQTNKKRIKEISVKLKTHLTWLDIIVYERELLKNEINLDHGHFYFQR